MKRLVELRNSKNLMQKEVAEYIGVDRTTYVKYERGQSQPNFEILAKLADFFNVTTDFLLVDELPRGKILRKLQLTLGIDSKEMLLITPMLNDEFFVENIDIEGTPILNGLLYDRSIYLWCKYCQYWHHHGYPDAVVEPTHRGGHCQNQTRYKDKGYIINPILNLNEILEKPLTTLDTKEYPVMAKYRKLDASSQEFVDLMIDREYQRYIQSKGKGEMHIPDIEKIKAEAEQVAQILKNQNVPTKK